MKRCARPLLFAFLLCWLNGFGQTELQYHGVHSENQPEWIRMLYGKSPDPGDVTAAFEAYYANTLFVKNAHTQYYKRWLRTIARSLPTDGRQEADRRYLMRRKQERSEISNRIMPSVWQSIGPWGWDHEAVDRSYAPGAAHVYVVEQSASNPDRLYAGTATAGIWKSLDHGENWVCITNDLMINGCTTLEINHQNPDIVYAEILSSVYKTTNSGTTWSPTGDAGFQALSLDIKDIVMHPNDQNFVLAATNGGLYRSLTAGNSWTQVLSNNVLEVTFHPTNHDTIYAVRNVVDVTEFFRSVDGGSTFVQQSAGWPVPDVANGEHQKRTEIAVTIAAPDMVYALATGSANGGSGLYGVYISNDAGENWSFQCCGPQPAGPPSSTNQNLMGWSDQGTDDGGQFYYDLAFDVSPNNSDSLFVAGVNLWVSDDSGASFVCPAKWSHSYKPNYVHADIHDAHYYESSGEIWIACDGGIFSSDDNGANFSRKMNGISGTDFWGFGMGFWEGDVMLGGTYHNGTLLKDNGVYLTGWISTDGGDGYRGFVNPVQERQVYSDYNIKQLSGDRTVNNTTRTFSYKPNATYTTGRSSELLFHPTYYGTWYSGSGTALWKTEDNGYTFDNVFDFGVDLASMAISWSNPEVLYACTFPDWWAVKRIYRSEDGGGTWTEITPPGAALNGSNTWVPYDIEVSASDPDQIWILRTSMYGGTNLNGVAVFSSDNGGQTWQNITTTTLDGQAFTCLMHQKGTDGGLYIGTRVGVFYRNSLMVDWELYSAGLPATTNATRLMPYYRKSTLRNATNRSVWERDFYENSQPIAQASTYAENYYCLEDTVYFRDHSVISENGASWLWSMPGATPVTSTDRNPKVLYEKPGAFDVTLTVSDISGTDTRTFVQMVHISSDCALDSVPGKALLCVANPDHVNIASLGITTDSFTMSAWVKPEGIQDDYTGIVMNDGSSAGFNFREGNNTLGYHWPGGAWWWDSNLEVTENKWSYVAMVVTPNEVRLYVNGEEAIHQVSISPVLLETMRIGSYHGWASRNLRGAIDEVCLWNRALTRDEIRSERHLVKIPADDATLIAYYQFNANGSIVYDKAESFDGVLNGSASKVHSRVPVGSGVSQSLVINTTGTYDFDETGLKMTFGSGATVPDGEVYATRLFVPPDTSVNNAVTLDIGYWILNNYGTQQLTTNPDSLMLQDIAFVSAEMAGSTLGTLRFRPPNSEISNWFNVDILGELSPGKHGSAEFHNLNGLTRLGQLLITRDSFPVGVASMAGLTTPLINEPQIGGSSILLDLKGDNQGLLLPVLSQSEFEQLPSPVPGLCGYLTEEKTVCFFDGTEWKLLETQFIDDLNTNLSGPKPGFGIGVALNVPSALLHMAQGQGLILPTIFADTSLMQIDFPHKGLLIYDATLHQIAVYDGVDWHLMRSSGNAMTTNISPPLTNVSGIAIGTNTKNPNAILELVSEDRALGIPVAKVMDIAGPVEGLLVFDPQYGTLCLFDGAHWQRILFQ